MFTITNRIRTIVAVSAVGAVLGSTGVASAATIVRSPATVAPTLVAPPSAIPDKLDPNKVGGANSGYTNQDCEELAQQYNDTNDAANATSDSNAAKALDLAAATILDTIETHCFIMD